jgi:hypothetical protein
MDWYMRTWEGANKGNLCRDADEPRMQRVYIAGFSKVSAMSTDRLCGLAAAWVEDIKEEAFDGCGPRFGTRLLKYIDPATDDFVEHMFMEAAARDYIESILKWDEYPDNVFYKLKKAISRIEV